MACQAIARMCEGWSGRKDSNLRPLGPKPSALPTALRPDDSKSDLYITKFLNC